MRRPMRPAIVPWRCRCSGSCGRRSGSASSPSSRSIRGRLRRRCSAVAGSASAWRAASSSSSCSPRLIWRRASAGAAAVLQRAAAADLAGEVRAAEPGLGGADLDGVPGRAGDRARPAGRSSNSRLPRRSSTILPSGTGASTSHIALGQLGADWPVAVGGIAEDPARVAARAAGRRSGAWPAARRSHPPGATCTAVISGSLLLRHRGGELVAVKARWLLLRP